MHKCLTSIVNTSKKRFLVATLYQGRQIARGQKTLNNDHSLYATMSGQTGWPYLGGITVSKHVL